MTYGAGTYGGAPYGAPGLPAAGAGLTVEGRIERILFASVAALQIEGEPPLAWPNVPFTPPSPSSTYVRVQHLRNTTTRMFAKGSDPHLRQGILQLTVVTPLALGPTSALGLAASIASQYAADLALHEDAIKVRVQSAPDVATPEKTDVSHDVRVDVRYEAFA